MSLSFIGEGDPIARIIDRHTHKSRFLYLNDPEEEDPEVLELAREAKKRGVPQSEIQAILSQQPQMDEVEIDYKEEQIIVLPTPPTERCYASGIAGSGKTTLVAHYMIEYLKQNPENRIFMFNRHDDDPAYEGIPIQWITVDNDELLSASFSLDEFSDSLVVFDDVDNLQDPKMKKWMIKVANDLFCNGRKKGISCFYVSHVMFNALQTQTILIESTKLFCFPQTGNYHIERYLKDRIGIDKDKIKRFFYLTEKSRWVCICRRPPLHVIHEKGAFIL